MKTLIIAILFSFGMAAQARVVTNLIDITSKAAETDWLSYNSVGLQNGRIVPVTTALKGNGCQLTRESNYGQLISLKAGTQFLISDESLSVVKTDVCLDYDVVDMSGDDVCVKWGAPLYSAVLKKSLQTKAQKFSLVCEATNSQSVQDAVVLFESSISGILN